MTYNFGDSFDLYAAAADMGNGYWDIAPSAAQFQTGRFTGSRGITPPVGGTPASKSSGVNDAVHHLVCSCEQTSAITGSSLGTYFELFDGTTAQCSIVFRSDGAILLTSGGPVGTVLDTYTGAITTQNTWFAFEFEVVINNTTGSWAVRKNGNASNDHALGSLNTRGSANNYANKLSLGQSSSVAQVTDDLFWQSGSATGTWLGDIRCYARMPASDQSVTFSRTPTSSVQTPFTGNATQAIVSGTARYTQFAAAYDGAIDAATVSLGVGYTGNLKCSIFASSGTAPTTVLGSATPISNPVAGSNMFTFGAPISVSKGTQYWIGFDSDTSSGTWSIFNANTLHVSSTTAYASFPVASPTVIGGIAPIICSLTITIGTNNCLVNEAQQDGLASYVYDSNPGDADWYGLAGTAGTPAYVIATTIRGYATKLDAGTRIVEIQLQSGATTVATPPSVLTTSGWQWAYRTDVVDPNTGAAWAPSSSVNVALIGPVVTA